MMRRLRMCSLLACDLVKRMRVGCWIPVLVACCATSAFAQTFTRITTGNELVTDPVPGSSQYTGCAWADFDGDGDQDLYVVQQGLYRNDGAGAFTRVAGMPADHSNALGCSWADVDNDGDPDLYVSGGPPGGSSLYRNDGGGVFTRISTGVIGTSNLQQGWGCAWGDYDNDGRCDLIIAAAFGFNGIITPCHLLHNDGNGDFTSADTSIVVTIGNGPYTVPSWNDIDDDGDLDLFIASGPATGSPDRDFLYENRGTQPGQTFFRRITTGALATDLHDAQLYNWVDIDGDGDLDCYVTNYGGQLGGFQNTLYRNNAGVFTKLTAAVAGAIISDAQHSLASVWGDFDNDGDMDCYVSNEAGEISMYYTNNGSGVFTNQSASTLHAFGPHWGAAAADYDQDGDLDLYAHGSAASRGLYRNDSPGTNAWLNVRCVGSTSNRSAIGAKVWMRATIGGVSRRLVQLVSAQNSFNGHNPFELHFGAGDATVADSIIVRFPSGITRVFTQVALRQTLLVNEDPTAAVDGPRLPPADGLGVEWLAGNPVRERVRFALTTAAAGEARLLLADASGRIVLRRTLPARAGDRQVVDMGSARTLAPGTYWLRIVQADRARAVRVVVLR